MKQYTHYLTFGILLFFVLIFYLQIALFSSPAQNYEDNNQIIKLTTSNGATISALYLPAKNSTFTLLVGHGNAVDLGSMYPYYYLDMQQQGYGVFTYDCRGYETCTGRPSEQHTYYDIDAAYKYMVNKLNNHPNNIILFGESLGAAAATGLAARKKVSGIILQSLFVTALRVVTRIPYSFRQILQQY